MKTDVLERLANETVIALATFRRNGVAVETPVWFAVLDGTIGIVTEGPSAKVKRIRATPRVRFAPCGYARAIGHTILGALVTNRVHGEWIEGTAHVHAGDSDFAARAHAALVRKYGIQMRLLDVVSRLSGAMAERVYLEVGIQ